jgi:outer membrane protein TolC
MLRNLAVQRYPQLTTNGEATYQSEVASIPVNIPGVEVPEPPKARVEAALNADLLLYDGGALEARRAAERAQLAAEKAEIAATLYPLRAEVSQSFFSALLLQERMRESATLIEELEARLALVRSRVLAGAALPGDTAALRADLLRVQQQRQELAAERRVALLVLGRLTGREISGADVLVLPELASERMASAELRPHPQYEVFAARGEALERQAAVIRARSRPQASAFGKLAYGRPGLQQFTDEFHEYGLVGIRVRWTPWDWGANRRERQELRLQREILDTEEAAFAERLRRQVERPLAAITRLREALETDERIIALREQIVRQTRAQFDERAVTAAQYVDALTDLEAARVARLRHRVELVQARADYLNILGVELR